MAAAIAATATVRCRFTANPSLPPRSAGDCLLLFRPSPGRPCSIRSRRRRHAAPAICFVLKEVGADTDKDGSDGPTEELRISSDGSSTERKARKQAERRTYLIAAVMSSLGITSMAVAAVYYRFSWQMEGGEVPLTEMFGTFALSVGAAVGMEFWARWAHRALWHASLWHMHESHHRPRDGPFELNDVFAIINAVPAISLISYGFLNRGLLPGLCFGAVSRYPFSIHCSDFRNDAYSTDAASSYRAWGLLSSAWPTCSFTTAWSTAASPWAQSPTSPTSAVSPPPTRSTTWTSSRGFRMGCSWDPRSWRKWAAWRSWRRRSTEEPSSTTILIKVVEKKFLLSLV